MTLEEAYLLLRVSPLQCLTSVLLAGFTIPFPSHRTFSFPESGGPTVFLPQHAQANARTR